MRPKPIASDRCQLEGFCMNLSLLRYASGEPTLSPGQARSMLAPEMTRRRAAWITAGVVLALLASAPGIRVLWRERRIRSAAHPLDVVLVTLDTTRADRLGCYGSAAGATPNLDALARGGV